MEKNENQVNYVYFIENHQKKEIAKLSFLKKYIEVGNLEMEYEIKDNPDYEILIYRFQLLNENVKKKLDKLDITIKLSDKENNKFENTLTNIKLNQDNFCYEFQFGSSKNFFKKKIPPKSLKLPYIDQFNYYLNYLRNKLKCNKDSVKNEYLVSSIQKILKEDNEYDFISYLLIFRECSSPLSIQEHLNLFQQNKIKPKKDVDKKILSELKDLVDSWEKNPDIILSTIEKKKEEYKITLFSIIFYFNYNYCKERIKIFLNNKIIYKGLFSSYTLFNLNFSQEYMKNFMEEVTEFKQLYIVFKFNSRVIELLEIINEFIDKIISLFLVELKKPQVHKDKNQGIEYPIVDFGEFVIPNEKDDLELIMEQIKCVIHKIMEKTSYLIIKFNPSFFEKYMDIFYKKNLHYLLIMKDLSKFMKDYDNSFEIKKNINTYIHDTGIALCLKGKLNNKEIINFVKNDDYFLPNTSFIKEKTSANIFTKLDIRSMDANFIKNWKKIKWVTIYGEEYLKFVDIIIHLINHIKDFGLLYELLNIYEKKKYGEIVLKKVQDHYIDLYKKTYKIEDCPNFKSDSITLLDLSDKFGENIDIFISSQLEKTLGEELINDIYLAFLLKYKNISKVAENKIIYFFLNKKKKIQSQFFLYLLENYKSSQHLIIPHFKKYKLKTEDFFSIEESENIKMLHALLIENIDYSEDQSYEDYIGHNYKLLEQIKKDIDNYNIIYKDIKHFFLDKKSEISFKKRLLIIYLLDDKMRTQKFQLIYERFHKITNIIKDLELLIDDQKFFFKNSKNIDINKINNLIKKIEDNNLKFCENNNEIIEYEPIIKDAKERANKRKSKIYMAIYNKEKEKEPNNDKKCLDIVNAKFERYKPYLTCQNINNLDEEYKEIIKALNFSREKMDEEADILMTIFNFKDCAIKKKIINSFLSLFYKNKIINLLSSLKRIIEITKVQKEYLSKLIDIIIFYLEKNEIISTIHFHIQLLKIYSIDIFDENNKFNKILIKFFEHPDSMEYLLSVNLEDLNKIKENTKDEKIIDNINQIIKFVKIFEKKEELSKMKDKELIKKIQKEISECYEKNTQTDNDKIESLWEIEDIIKFQINL